MDLRAEVALLSRTISILGDDDSDTDLFGAQVIVRGPASSLCLSHVAIARCGQAFLTHRAALLLEDLPDAGHSLL